MKDFVIITDSNIELSREMVAELGVEVVRDGQSGQRGRGQRGRGDKGDGRLSENAMKPKFKKPQKSYKKIGIKAGKTLILSGFYDIILP